jgi:very-short-patch-repair endonuclease
MRRKVPDKNRSFAKSMRNEPTDAEYAMWQIIRGKRLEGLRFRRQHPIANYIVDFICLDEKLVIEIDGSQHAESSYDLKRDRDLEALGYTVLRFWNEEVLRNADLVAEKIVWVAGKGNPRH